MRIFQITILIAIIYLSGCTKEFPPEVYDGNGILQLKVTWDKSLDTIPDLQPLPNAQVILNSRYGIQIYNTGPDGSLNLNNLPSAIYNVVIKGNHPELLNITLVGTIGDINIISGKPTIQGITAKPVPASGISLNEIYVDGALGTPHYYWDQFIELYNSSDSTKYLDGMMLMRVTGNNPSSTPPGTKGPGADEYNDGNIWGMTYIYKFPGNAGEKNHPFYSKKFLVLAGVAIDHRKSNLNSIDLSHADWQIYNQYNPTGIYIEGIPTLINMNPERTAPFMVGLSSDIIILADGTDPDWTDGININSIVDAVQYSTKTTPNKTLDDRLDKGVILSPLNYTGKSMQRKEPGMDLNISTLDWEILPSPTPGRQ